jgi:Uma2 family endonuclease
MAQSSIATAIGSPFNYDGGGGGPGGWWILTETLVQFDPDTYRPDIAGWRRERLPDPGSHTVIPVIPDWCCEVVSRSNASNDRVKKRRAYARAGVRHYWLVDPEARVLEALELDVGQWRECGAWDDTAQDARIPPFEAVALDVGRFFFPQP